MRKIVVAILIALALSGCATNGQYGNFVPTASGQQQMAADAVQQLTILYPPAKTRFELHQATPDAFGVALVNALREHGYALLEFGSASQGEVSTATVETPASLSLRYVFDQAGTTNLYRLTLLVDNQSITRPYLKENGSFEPAGYWARKE